MQDGSRKIISFVTLINHNQEQLNTVTWFYLFNHTLILEPTVSCEMYIEEAFKKNSDIRIYIWNVKTKDGHVN